MKINLSGRAAIVTGGSKGIGFAVATRFAASGADVAISEAAEIRRAFDEVMKAFDKVDIIVNNACASSGP